MKDLNEIIYLKQYVGLLNREIMEEEDDWTDASKDNLSILKRRNFANTYLNDRCDYKHSENNEVEEEKQVFTERDKAQDPYIATELDGAEDAVYNFE